MFLVTVLDDLFGARSPLLRSRSTFFVSIQLVHDWIGGKVSTWREGISRIGRWRGAKDGFATMRTRGNEEVNVVE